MVLAVTLAASLVSFESAVQQIRADIHHTRAEQLKTKDAALAARLDRVAWDVQRREREASRLRSELSDLRRRLQLNRGDMRWEVQRVARSAQDHARELQWNLQEVRAVRQAMTEKDPDLAAPARRLDSQTRWLVSESRWLQNEGRWIGSDLRRAGYTWEAFDIERGLRDAEDSVRDLENEVRAILAKL